MARAKPITWAQAEKLVGKRVDRRRSYARDGRVLLESCSGTFTCSGCFNSVDGHPVGHYPLDAKHRVYIGAGCEECGYTGKRRWSQWVPSEHQAKGVSPI